MKLIHVFSVIACVGLFLFLLSTSSAYFYTPQTYDELKTSEGELYFGIPKPRYSAKIYLKQGHKSFEVTCQLTSTYGFGCGLDGKARASLSGKHARVKWQAYPGMNLSNKVLLNELIVNDEVIIPYQDQLKVYSQSSNINFYIFLIMFLIMLVFCIGLFFDNFGKNDAQLNQMYKKK